MDDDNNKKGDKGDKRNTEQAELQVVQRLFYTLTQSVDETVRTSNANQNDNINDDPFTNNNNNTQQQSHTTTTTLQTPERDRLRSILSTGVWQGAVAGLLSLAVLRTIRTSFLRRSGAYNVFYPRQKSPFANSSSHHPTKPSPLQSSTTTQQQQQQQSQQIGAGRLFNALSWMIDASVSLYVATAVSLRNREEMMEQFSQLPLLEGKSMVADTICPTLIREYQHIVVQESQQQNAIIDFERPQTRRLQIMKDFVRNCRLRAAYEHQLRQQQGLSPTQAVPIPPPGVPMDTTMDTTTATEPYPDRDGAQPQSTTHPTSGSCETHLWKDDTSAFYEPLENVDDTSVLWGGTTADHTVASSSRDNNGPPHEH